MGKSTSSSSTPRMWSPPLKRCVNCTVVTTPDTQRAHEKSLLVFLQVGSRGIEAAWAGGSRGREVTDTFLPVVAQLLSTKGSFYLVTIAENDPGKFTDVIGCVPMPADTLNECLIFVPPEEIITSLCQQGLQGEPFLTRRAGNERLSVVRFLKG